MARLLICCLFFTLAFSSAFCDEPDPKEHEMDKDDAVTIEHVSEVKDCEKRTVNGDQLHIHYTGKLLDGKEFDSSVGKEPLQFRLGKGHVIKGWEEGLLDMCVGEKRKLTIPSSKGYGSQGAGDSIPPDSTLVFDVELVKISEPGEKSADEPDMDNSPEGFFNQLDKNKDNILTKEEFAEFIRETNGMDGQIGDGEGAPKPDGGTDAMIDQIFAQEDKNKDGIVTREEFIADKHDEL